MKKVFLFISIFLISLTSFFVACDDERYADLSIEVVSVQKINGENVSYNKEGNFYELYYGDEFIVSARVNSSNVVSRNVIFVSENNTAINKISQGDTSARFRAAAPSRDSKYRIKISSIETLKGNIDLYFKVVLPVSEINLSTNLAVAPQKPLDLNTQIKYKSDYDKSGSYEVDSKGVSFEIVAYIDNEGNETEVVGENGSYRLLNTTDVAFVIKNGCLEIVDESLDGKIRVQAKSEKYVEDLEEKLNGLNLDENEKSKKILQNERLKSQSDVEIIKPITLQDIFFEGGQTIFKNFNLATKKIKFDFDLYNNSLAKYTIDGNEYYYSNEVVNITVMSQEKFVIRPTLTSMFVGDNKYMSDENVVKFDKNGEIEIKENGTTVGKNYAFVISANKIGVGYIDFVVAFEYDNELTYSFGDLYKDYIESLDDDVYETLEEQNQTYTRLVANVCSLPKYLGVKQDSQMLNDLSSTVIFDNYGESYNEYGSQFSVALSTTNNTVTQEGIKESDRNVRVYINSGDATDIKNAFEIRDENGRKIQIVSLVESGNTYYYFDLLYSNNTTEIIFYIKAINVENDKNFTFTFKNIINSTIVDKNGNEIVAETSDNGLMGIYKTFYVTTKKGVSSMMVKNIVENDGTYTYYDLTHPDGNTLYSKIILNRNSEMGALIAYYINAGLEDEIRIDGYDEKIVRVNTNLDGNAINYFNGSYDSTIYKLGGVIALQGSEQVGTTRISFTANNGFCVTIDVVVVDEIGQVSLNVDDSLSGGNVVTENNLNTETPNISAVSGGQFNIKVLADGYSGIKDIEIASSNNLILSIDNGLALAKNSGLAQVSVVITYYTFKNMSVGNYYMWTQAQKTLTFDVNVFVPATYISLNRTKIEVYDGSTLPYNEIELSKVVLNIDVGGDATILKDEYANNFKFSLKNIADASYFESVSFDGFGFFYGRNFSSYIYLPTNANTNKTIIMEISVNEFGINRNFSCEIHVVRASQVEEIGVKTSVDINKISDNLYSMKVKNGENFEINTSIEDKVRNKNLVVFVNLANEDGDIGDYDSAQNYAYISNGKVTGYTLDLAGNDKFSLAIKNGNTGPFYLTIIAKDSYTSETNYTTYKRIKVIIENGKEYSYSIKNSEQLKAIENYPNANYELVNDIVLPDNWEPIKDFGGVLNGNNYTIRNLNISSTQTNNIGLFEKINNRRLENNTTEYGTVYNLNIISNSISLATQIESAEDYNIGVVAGVNEGIILNVSVKFNSLYSAIDTNNQNIGGLVGVNNGMIFNFPYKLTYSDDMDRNQKYFATSSTVFSNLTLGQIASSSDIESINISEYTNGNITVKSSKDVYVGGFVGKNNGTINGFYGIYDSYRRNNNVSYVTSFQNFGVDGRININTNDGLIASDNSSIGGVAGYNQGIVANVGVEGNIGSYNFSMNSSNNYVKNNIGGLVGINTYYEVSEANVRVGKVDNCYASVKVCGNENVGGAVGVLSGNSSTIVAEISNIKVENYQKTNNNSTLVAGVNNVGGLVGNCSYAQVTNSYTYGYSNKFDTEYVSFGDLYVFGQGYAGGLVGKSDENFHLNNNFSTFNLVAKDKSNSNVKGLVGLTNSTNDLSNNFYIGVIDRDFGDEDIKSLLGIDEISKFYYVLAYRDKDDISSSIKKDCFVCLFSYDTDSTVPDKVNISFDYYDSGWQKISKYSNLLIDIPTSFTIEGKGQDCLINGDEVRLQFNATSTNRNVYKYSIDETNVVIVGLSQDSTQNVISYNDLFNAISPDSTKISLIVNDLFASREVVTLLNNGDIVLNKVGQTTLRFTVKENNLIYKDVKVLVVNEFDKLVVSENINLSTSAFEKYTLENPLSQRLNTDFSLNYEILEEINSQLIEIANASGYTVDYSIYFSESEDGAFDIDALANNKITRLNKNFNILESGYFKVVVSIVFSDSDNIKYRYTSNNWQFYIYAYASAQSINFLESEIWVDGANRAENIAIHLYSYDNSGAPLLTIKLEDFDKNVLEFEPSFDEENNIYTYLCADSPFIISIKPKTKQGEAYIYSMEVSVKDEFKNVDKILSYILMVYDQAGYLINDYADIKINLVSAKIKSISTAHYSYTNQVNRLTNVTSPSTDEGANYFYSYINEKQDTIVSGIGGLLVIDLDPFYSNITSVTISTSLGNSGSSLSFAQMVKVKDSADANKEYYVYAPSTTTNNDGSVNLNLISSMPEASVEITPSGARLVGNINYFTFDEESSLSGNSIGRLYVKTTAPTLISENETFNIIVNVKYTALDENDQLVEKIKTHTHKVIVHSTPGMSISTLHEGKEREVIAYTGSNPELSTQPDWIDVVPNVEQNYNYTISYSVTSNGTDMGVGNTDYAVLRENGDNYKLTLGPSAKVGDIITINLNVEINYGDYIRYQVIQKQIVVVDIVIESLSIKGVDSNGIVAMSISSSRQLLAVINGFGLNEEIAIAERKISRAVADNGGASYYWLRQDFRTGDYVTLNSNSNIDDLPFVVNQISISNDTTTEVTIDRSYLGVINGNSATFKVNYESFYLEGRINEGTVSIRLSTSYVYNNGKILFIPSYAFEIDSKYDVEFDCDVKVYSGSSDENLITIENEEQLRRMQQGGNYILTNDITITSHTPFDAVFASLDGNNKVITIENFNVAPSNSNNNTSINIGLFGTIASGTIVKNLIVAIPNNKDNNSQLDLSTYQNVNYGVFAGVNNGIITNCEIITLNRSDFRKGYLPYSISIKTNSHAVANIGGFVGYNTGIITNSRVGRSSVYVYKQETGESVVFTKTQLQNVSSKTIISVDGAGSVSGFVSTNTGTVSSSYAKNLQIELYNQTEGINLIKSAGFVVTNSGYIYGSYATGWEESNSASLTSDSRILGGGIYSNGTISGFVYENRLYISDCYSNINLSGTNYEADYINNSGLTQRFVSSKPNPAPGVSGFVYIMSDSANIMTSYSLSKIIQNSDMSGIFESQRISLNKPDYNVHGNIEDCYFLRENTESFDCNNDRAKELSTSAVVQEEDSSLTTGINQFISPDYFNGFAFDSTIDNFSTYTGQSSGGVWAMQKFNNNSGYPELISANTIAISCRKINLSSSANGEITQKYFVYISECDIGSEQNPYLISNVQEYNKLFTSFDGDSFNDSIASKFTKNIRLINNINFAGITAKSTNIEYTSIIGEKAIFDGNYLSMYNISLADSNEGKYSFGLFRDIYRAGVKNLTLGISNISAGNSTSVGALAGVIVDSNISNINLVSNGSGNSSGVVLGNNYVGALAGIITSSHPSDRDADSVDEIYYISNINSNLSILGSRIGSISSSIKTEFKTWQEIKPVSNTSGIPTIFGNLRLYNLNRDAFYAGGIAGVIDLRQEYDVGSSAVITKELASNIHVGEFTRNSSIPNADYTSTVEILSDFAGGLFGYVGCQTHVTKSEFIVDENSSISAGIVGGGLTAMNFGMISKSYVSYAKDTTTNFDEQISNYVKGLSIDYSKLNKTLFAKNEVSFKPSYIGGLVGINVGGGVSSSGSIINCYNRVDVRNSGAIAVGGIVGGSYIGKITNVYTTASLMANLNSTRTVYIGGIIGRIFDDASDGYFNNFVAGSKKLELNNIVALNLWDSNDFNLFYDFVNNKNGIIGGLYGYYINEDSSKEGIVSMNSGSNVFFQEYILKSYNNSYLSEITSRDKFVIDNYISKETNGEVTYINLWGSSKTSGYYYDSYLAKYLALSEDFLIQPHEYKIFFSNINSDDCVNLRNIYFSSLNWTRDVWSYEEDQYLPILDYGFRNSTERIYTAQDFIDKVSVRDNAKNSYLIMNDIDFSTLNGGKITPITTTFSGTIIGNPITIEESGRTYTRYPILYNINLVDENCENPRLSLFEYTSNATISHINLVVNNYQAMFKDPSSSKSKASILMGYAENTTLNDVNIYDCLTDVVYKDILDSDIVPTLKDTDLYMSSGVSTNVDKQIDSFSTPYLKVKQFNTGTGIVGADENKVYTFKYQTSSEKFALTSINDIPSGTTITSGFEPQTIDVTQGQIKTNAMYFGAFVASTEQSIVYIERSSTNIDVQVEISTSMTSVYYGSFVGYGKGNIYISASQSSIELISNVDKTSTSDIQINDIGNLYMGNVVGYFEGEIESLYVDNAEILVGSAEKVFNVNVGRDGGSGGAYLGGVAGISGTYTSITNNTSGKLEKVYVRGINIVTFIQGQQFIGGVVAKNQASISDVYVRSNRGDKIEVNLTDNLSNCKVGGVVAENTTTLFKNIYSNINIKTIATNYNSLFVGGILASTSATMEFENVVCDAETLTHTKNVEASGRLNLSSKFHIGGIIGQATSSLSMYKILSTVDIVCSQEAEMFVGGLIGYASDVKSSSVIGLGNITLSRGVGSGTKTEISDGESTIVNYDTFLYNDEIYYVGGFAGLIPNTFSIDNEKSSGRDYAVLIATTIRDYALGQKTNVNIGSILGGLPINFNGDLGKLIYNENISLVSNENTLNENDLISGVQSKGVNEFSSIAQDELSSVFEALFDMFKIGSNLSETVKYTEGFYSNLYVNYINSDYLTTTDKFVIGSKLNPIIYNGEDGYILANNNYYIARGRDNDTSGVITINGSISCKQEGVISTNWVFNAQGYTIVAKNGDLVVPVFDLISEGSAVTGLFVEVKGKVSSNYASIATRNDGFIFSCGVGGKITGDRAITNVASFVYYNFGVINRSFSIAEMEIGSGAGLVLYNGCGDRVDGVTYNESKIGNIYDCFFTGSIEDKSPMDNSSIISGIVYDSKYGTISNSFTMADIHSNYEKRYNYIYSVVCVNSIVAGDSSKALNNFYRTYYDNIAYIGNNGSDIGVDSIDKTQVSTFISKQGIYVWTNSFSGDVSFGNIQSANAKTILDMFQTNWLGQSNLGVLRQLYNKAMNRTTVDPSSSVIENTWFNYGYISKNFTNILRTSNSALTIANGTKYFKMIYTGNGLANKENESTSTPSQTDIFVNKPYSVKHGGLLDMLVTENCSYRVGENKVLKYRYYVFTRDIDLRKYSGITYWSENWDKINAVFYGSLDGNNKTVSNMFATYGLVRAIPVVNNDSENPDFRKTEVKNIIFSNCKSKTGLVAGYFGSGTISNIYVDGAVSPNYVYNGNLFETIVDCDSVEYDNMLKNYEDASKVRLTQVITDISLIKVNDISASEEFYYIDPYLYNKNVKVAFAGGLVGVMLDGEIKDVIINGLDVIAYSQVKGIDKNSGSSTEVFLKEVSYIGGLVGLMQKGKIEGNGSTGFNLPLIESGTDAGKADTTKIEGIQIVALIVAPDINSSTGIAPFMYVGGIVGAITGGEIAKVNIDEIIGSDDGEVSNVKIMSLYSLGGFAGKVDGGSIVNCNYMYKKDGGLIENSADRQGLFIAYATWIKDDSGTPVIKIVNYSNFTEDDLNGIDYIYLTEMYIGGIAGVISKGLIENSHFISASINIYAFKLSGLVSIYVGGIVGDIYEMSKTQEGTTSTEWAIIRGCTIASLNNVKAIIKVTSAIETCVGGIIGRMRGGHIYDVYSGVNFSSISNTTVNPDELTSPNGNVEINAQLGNIYNTGYVYFGFKLLPNKDPEKFGAEWGGNSNELVQKYYDSVTWHNNSSDKFTEVYSQGKKFIGDKSGNTFVQFALNNKFYLNAGFATAGGIVGKAIKGSLAGYKLKDEYKETGKELYISKDEYNSLKDTDKEYYNKTKIVNLATVKANSSAGGIVGEISILNLKLKVEIDNAYNYGNIYAFSAIKGNIDTEIWLESASELRYNYNAEIDFDSFIRKSANLDGSGSITPATYAKIVLDISIYFETSFSGGIVGYAKIPTTCNISDTLIKITNCKSGYISEEKSSAGVTIGSPLSTFSGGIVGLVYNLPSNSATLIEISHCVADCSLRGYMIKSFAGGIVGYLSNAYITNCEFKNSVFNSLSNGFEGVGDSLSSMVTKFKNFFSIATFLSVPNVAGGIVGYMESGLVEDCNVDNFGTIIATRVAGGIIGVAAGGKLSAKTMVKNDGFVWAFQGVAGGIFGVLLDSFELGTVLQNGISITGFIEKLMDSNFNFEQSVQQGLLKGASESGVFINGFTGIVIGNISGGIVGYIYGSGERNVTLSTAINLGRTYTSIISMITGATTLKDMARLPNDINDVEFDSLVSEDVNSTSQLDIKLSKIFDKMGSALGNISAEAGITVDGEKFPLIKLGLSGNILGYFNSLLGGAIDLGFDENFRDKQNISALDYIKNIVVNKYKWNDNLYEVGLLGRSRNLKPLKNICNISDETKSDNYLFKDITLPGEESKAKDNAYGTFDYENKDNELGFGTTGGVVGYINNQGNKTISIALALNFGLDLSVAQSIPVIGDIIAFLTPVTSSDGIGGGIVGMAKGKIQITSSINATPVVGRVSGGIVGCSLDNNVEILTVNEAIQSSFDQGKLVEMIGNIFNCKKIYGPVSNLARVVGDTFAGGIIGYAIGGKINSSELVNLLSSHDIGIYASATVGENEYSWFSDKGDGRGSLTTPDISGWPIFQVTNSGQVYGRKFAGGIIGYNKNAEIYMARNSGSLLGTMANLGNLLLTLVSSGFMGGSADATAGQQYIQGGFAGGIVGYMENGIVDGSCYVGSDDNIPLLGNVFAVRIGSSRYFNIPTNDIETNVDPKTYTSYGGYAGGIVGYLAGGKVGGLHNNRKIACAVKETTMFALTNTHLVNFVGGAVGYCKAEMRDNLWVVVEGKVTNGLYTGGLYGEVDKGSTLNFGIESSDKIKCAIIGKNLGKKQTAQGDDTKSVHGTIVAKDHCKAGGIVGYLQGGTIENILSAFGYEGEVGGILGGIVGELAGGTIKNSFVANIQLVDGKKEIAIKDINSTTIDKEKYGFDVSNNGLTKDSFRGDANKVDITSRSYVGGIVGLASSKGSAENTEAVIIEKCAVLTNIRGGIYTGGIVGGLQSKDAKAKITVDNVLMLGSINNAEVAGGIVGNTKYDMSSDSKVINVYVGSDLEKVKNIAGIDWRGIEFKDNTASSGSEDANKKIIGGAYASGGIVGLLGGTTNIASGVVEHTITSTTSNNVSNSGNAPASRIAQLAILNGIKEFQPIQDSKNLYGYVGGLVGMMSGGYVGKKDGATSGDTSGESGELIAPAVKGSIVGGIVGFMCVKSTDETASAIAGGQVNGNVELIDNGQYAGGLVGRMKGGKISGTTYQEGITQSVVAKEENTSLDVETDTDRNFSAIGGLVGLYESVTEDEATYVGKFEGDYTAYPVEGGVFAGGIIGEAEGDVTDCGLDKVKISSISKALYAGLQIGKMNGGSIVASVGVNINSGENNVTVEAKKGIGLIIGYAGPTRSLVNVKDSGRDTYAYRYDNSKITDLNITQSSSNVVIQDGITVSVKCESGTVGGIIGVASHNMNLKLANITLTNSSGGSTRNVTLEGKKVGGIVGEMYGASIETNGILIKTSLGDVQFNITSDGSFGGIVGQTNVLKTLEYNSNNEKYLSNSIKNFDLKRTNFKVSASSKIKDVGSIVGTGMTVYMQMCRYDNNIFGSDPDISCDIANYGGIAGSVGIDFEPTKAEEIADFNTIKGKIGIYGCVNEVNLTTDYATTNLGGIVGEASNYYIGKYTYLYQGSVYTVNSENYGNLTLRNKSMNAVGDGKVSPWAYSNDSSDFKHNKVNSQTDMQNTFSGSVGGLVGNAIVSEDTKIGGSDVKYSSNILGKNSGEINGFYYYAHGEEMKDMSYYCTNSSDSDIVYIDYIIDNRGQIVGSKNKDLSIGAGTVSQLNSDKDKKITVTNLNPVVKSVKGSLLDGSKVIDWTYRNEHVDTRENSGYEEQPSYYIGYKVTVNTSTYKQIEDDGIWEDSSTTTYYFSGKDKKYSEIEDYIKAGSSPMQATESLKSDCTITGAEENTTKLTMLAQINATNGLAVDAIVSTERSSEEIKMGDTEPTEPTNGESYIKSTTYQIIYGKLNSTYTYTPTYYGEVQETEVPTEPSEGGEDGESTDEGETTTQIIYILVGYLQDCGGSINKARDARKKNTYIIQKAQRYDAIKDLYTQTSTTIEEYSGDVTIN